MLCLWLPFTDGTTKNQGLIQDGITTDVTPTFINDGKLGKCLNKGQIDISADTTAKILNNQELTISFWLYVNAKEGSTTNSVSLFGNDDMSVNNNRKFSLFQYPTCNDLHLSWMNDAASTVFLSATYQGVLPSYKWTHVAVTYNNPNATIYINGQIYAKKTGISNSSSFKYKTRVVWNNTYRYLNDLRIYNTCLSPRQVKEISKGLICHYPLGEIDGKIGGRNLFKGTRNFTSGVSSVSGLIDMSNTVDSFTVLKAKCSTDRQYYDPYSLSLNMEAHTFYTLSFYAKADSSCIIKSYFYDIGNSGEYVDGRTVNTLTASWKKYTITWKTGDTARGASVIPMRLENTKEVWAYIYGIKFEKSNKATPWTPAPEDDTSFYDNVIYDTSGYCNNGNVADSTCPTWSSDTCRYKGSYVFNGNNQYFTFHNPITSSSTDFTISCWVKFDDTTDTSTICTMRTAVGNGIALFKVGNKIRFDDNAQFTFSDYTISANAWTHVVVTRSSSAKKLYINGELKQSTSTVGDMANVYDIGSIGASSDSGNNFWNYTKGNISDFRIYATALDNQTIEELYKVGASVDNNGNLLTYEIEEEL